ncbi:MAG: trypsin-like peptidase domain-containing protein [Candidatus Moranbacteria bacterium]|nr:trypsin-like peptidase domain-containing protein [Candidatus Moranbacteria bacterium]
MNTIDIGNKKEAESAGKAKLSKSLIAGILMLSIFVSVIFGTLFGFMAGGASNLLFLSVAEKLGKVFPGLSEKKMQIEKQSLIEEDSAVIRAVENSSPAVISIIVTKDMPKLRNLFENPFGFDFRFFSNPFGNAPGQGDQQTEKQKIGGGSGFFASSGGMIVTNRHVVEDTQADYTVVTNDGKEYTAQVLARDPVRDIAVIKIEGNNFPVLKLGDSDALRVGQTVIAIGNSLGEFSNTVSKGIISGLKRNVTAGSSFGQTEQLSNIIQTDAAINPGNSGGPLLDIGGNVIGVNVAMAQGAENIGFALPINQVKKVIEQVESKGEISIPFLGVRYVIIDNAIKEQNNLPFDYGVLVIRGERMTDLAVVPDSPADKAGIIENDIILEIGGNKITQDSQLGDLIAKYNVGDTVTLKVWHKGETKEVKVTLDERK